MWCPPHSCLTMLSVCMTPHFPDLCSGLVWLSGRALAAWAGCAGPRLGLSEWSWVKSELQWYTARHSPAVSSDQVNNDTVDSEEELPSMAWWWGHVVVDIKVSQWIVMWASGDQVSFTASTARRPAHLAQCNEVLIWYDSQVCGGRIRGVCLVIRN